jgi:chemotaxis protein MotA
MDIATVVGLVLGIGALFATALLEGTHLSALVNIPAFVLIVGGSFGATIVSFALSDIMRIPKFLKEALFAPPLGLAERARQLVELAQKARREGLLALEEDARNIDDPFLQKGLQLVVDGTEPEVVRAVLESEIAVWEEREKGRRANLHSHWRFLPDDGDYGRRHGLDACTRSIRRPEENGKGNRSRFRCNALRCWLCKPRFPPNCGQVESSGG